MLIEWLQRNAEYRPRDAAVVFGDEVLTHRALLDGVERRAHALAKLAGGRALRIATVLDNSPDFIATFYAAFACGGTNVPLSIEQTAAELAFCFDDAAVDCVVCEPGRLDLVRSAIGASERAPQIVVTGAEAVDGAMTFTALSAADLPLPSAFYAERDVALLYSSGSTGRPKCVPRTALQYWWETGSLEAAIGVSSADVFLCAIPLFHNHGLAGCMLAAARSGAKLVVLERPRPFLLRRQRVLDLIERERVTIFPAVPYILTQLAEGSATADLTSLRACFAGAAPLSDETVDLFALRFGVRVGRQYGCSEVGALTMDLADLDRHPAERGVGRPIPGVSVRIVDDARRDLPPGTVGEVAVRSRAMTAGYHHNCALNERVFADGFFYTGDRGCLDEQGRLHLHSRVSFVIDVAGHKVDPLEIEAVLAEYPAVHESVVIGAEGQIRAFVVLAVPCDERDLLGYCRKRLASYKVPSEVVRLRTLPKDVLGKVVRHREILERSVA